MAAASAQWRGLAEIVIDHGRPASQAASWQELVEPLEDDFNTPEALAVLHRWHRGGEADLLTRGLEVFGLPRPARIHKVHVTATSTVQGSVSVDVVRGAHSDTSSILASRPGVIELFRRRLEARRRGDYSVSDELRDRMREDGVEVEDTEDGGRLVIRESQ